VNNVNESESAPILGSTIHTRGGTRGVPAVSSPGIGGGGVETLGWRHDREGGRGELRESRGGARGGGLVRLGGVDDAHVALSWFYGCFELGTRRLRLLRGCGMAPVRAETR